MLINNLEKFPKRIAGKKTWQYTAWLKLMADIKAEGISSEHSIGIRTAKGKFVHHDLLNYQRFYFLISQIRSKTDVRDAILVKDFFNEGFINSDNLFYLPKRLVQNYRELLNYKLLDMERRADKYTVRFRDAKGLRRTVDTFSSLVEARSGYYQAKVATLTELFNIYRGFLPVHFCERFDKQLNFLKEATKNGN